MKVRRFPSQYRYAKKRRGSSTKLDLDNHGNQLNLNNKRYANI